MSETGPSQTTPSPDGSVAPWKLLLAFLAAFLGFNALAIALPHDPYVRYQQIEKTLQFRATWAYERNHFDKVPIDVAVIGNSRLAAAIGAPALSKSLSEQLGRPMRAVNMSLPQEGDDAHYVMARQVLRDHPEVKLIVLSAIEQMPRMGHPAFRSIADAGDIVTAPVVINQDYFGNLTSLPYRQMSLFVQSLMPGVFDRRTAPDPKTYLGTDYDTTRNYTNQDGEFIDRGKSAPPAEILKVAQARLRDIAPPRLPASMADQEFAISRSYERKVAALAKANGTQVAFLYLPLYTNRAPISDEPFYTAIGPLIDGRFLATRTDLYGDYAHVNSRGSALVTQWLGDQIAQRVKSGQIMLKDK
jgi:hypothetical protein